MRNASLIFLCTMYVVAGCQTNLDQPESSPQTAPTSSHNPDILIVTIDPNLLLGSSPTTYPEGVLMVSPVPETILDFVIKDLREKLGTGLENIYVLEIEAIDWPDSSLGCGQPGEVYLPVITPGFRIVLEVNGQIYLYHTNKTNYFILCETPEPILINPTPSR